MKLKTVLLRKGIFSRDSDAVSEEVLLWRKVLDEMLIGMIGTNTSAKDHSIRWFNSKPGDVDHYFDEETGEEHAVDTYAEFCEACSLADLDPNTVSKVANRTFKQIMEDLEHERIVSK